jgi:hypothetical protein
MTFPCVYDNLQNLRVSVKEVSFTFLAAEAWRTAFKPEGKPRGNEF